MDATYTPQTPRRSARIRRLVTAPVFAGNGSLLTTVGYHAKARVYCAPDFAPPGVASAPTATDLREARRLLVDELLVDFPFVDAADKAHAVALLLLFFARDFVACTGFKPVLAALTSRKE